MLENFIGLVIFVAFVYGLYRLAVYRKENRSSGTGTGGSNGKRPDDNKR